MKVAKEFRWEAAHRLPSHNGGCRNLHGHSYSLWVEVTGSIDKTGFVIDYKEIKKLLAPLIEQWDHATLICYNDQQLLGAVQYLESKYFLLPYETTCENLCLYVTDYIKEHAGDDFIRNGIDTIKVTVRETESSFAEHEVAISYENVMVR